MKTTGCNAAHPPSICTDLWLESRVQPDLLFDNRYVKIFPYCQTRHNEYWNLLARIKWHDLLYKGCFGGFIQLIYYLCRSSQWTLPLTNDAFLMMLHADMILLTKITIHGMFDLPSCQYTHCMEQPITAFIVGGSRISSNVTCWIWGVYL